MPLTGVRSLSLRLSQPIESAVTTATLKIVEDMLVRRCGRLRTESAFSDVRSRNTAVGARGRDARTVVRWSLASCRRRLVKFSTGNSEIAESLILPPDA